MRCKGLRRLAAAALAALLPLSLPLPSAGAEDAAAEPPGEVLVIYPEEADRRGEEDSLSALAGVLFSLGVRADYSEAAEAKSRLGAYDRVLWCATAPSERLDPAMLRGYEGSLMVLGEARGMEPFGLEADGGFAGEAMAVAEYAFDDGLPFSHSVQTRSAGRVRDAAYETGSLTGPGGCLPLACGGEKIRYIALTDYTDAFARAVLTQEAAQWLWPYESRMHIYTGHVVLDAVYPFCSPGRLKALTEYMTERKMNFCISVMPLYEHGDYPAMGQLCEVLRYAQANGGAVILHAPLIQGPVEADALQEKVTEAMRIYTDQGVYPLALEIPSEWLFREDLMPLLRCWRTLFLSDMDAFASHAVRDYGLTEYRKLGARQVLPSLRLDETGISRLARFSVAVYLDMTGTDDRPLQETIEAFRNSPVPMQSLWGMEQAVYGTGSFVLLWDKSTLTVNGEQRFNTYVPAESGEPFDYRRNEYYRFVTNLSNENHFLIGVSAVVLVVFLFLAYRSRRQMHKRFLDRISAGTYAEEGPPDENNGKEEGTDVGG